MKLRFLNDQELISRTENLAREERDLLTKVLHHLCEIDRRKLFSALGYKSLFEFTVKKLGYSEDQACRRISAMRLLREMPELESKINEGALNLTHLGMAQNLFRQEKKMDREISKNKKMEIFARIAAKPVREAESLLISYSSNPVVLRPDRVRTISEERVELKFTASKELLEKIETLKGYLAHSQPDISLGELVEKLCDLGVKQWAPSNKGLKLSQESCTAESPAAPRETCIKNQRSGSSERRSRTLSSKTRRRIFRESENKCSRCRSTYGLEIDHVKPRALGGTNAPGNLRVLCRACNQRQGIESLGLRQMNAFRSRRRSAWTPTPSVQSSDSDLGGLASLP